MVYFASKHQNPVGNWILITAKVAEWTARVNKLGGKPGTDPLFLFRSPH